MQALIPAAAIASDYGPAGEVICTRAGAERLPDGHHHGFGGLACEACVMASFAGVLDAPPAPPAPAGVVGRPSRPQARTAALGAALPLKPPARGPPALS
ncbi:MAG: hypothetical protein ACXWKT_20765 [Caulobacteraceae bacterium]